MFDPARIRLAVDLQARAYELLMWLDTAIGRGFLAPEAAHDFVTLDQAALDWMSRHFQNLPPKARPGRDELGPFSKLFSTFLTSSFELDATPGQRLYSEDAHCFCPHCSWLVRRPHLRPKKPGGADKKRADRMTTSMLRTASAELGRVTSDTELEALQATPQLREALALCTYAQDLGQRLLGLSQGAASLVLWRRFAWKPTGSPKPRFRLDADLILEAEAEVLDSLRWM